MSGHTVNRKDQRYIRRDRRELAGRYHRVNQKSGDSFLDHSGRHLWGCPGCGMQNAPVWMSCRYCPTLKWGVAP